MLEEALEQVDIEDTQLTNSSSEYHRSDHYWRHCWMKYPQLFASVGYVLCLCHGNSIPKRGFSLNKQLIVNHGTSFQDNNIIALRLVKCFLIQF